MLITSLQDDGGLIAYWRHMQPGGTKIIEYLIEIEVISTVDSTIVKLISVDEEGEIG